MPRFKRSDILMGGLFELPRDRYTARILEVKSSTSEKGNPTARLTCEIIAPEQLQIGDQNYNLAGRRFWPMPVLLDPTVDYGLGVLIKFLDDTGFDYTKFNPEGEIDTDRLDVLVGHTFDVQLSSREQFRERASTAEEVAELQKDKAKAFLVANAEVGKYSVYMTDGAGERLSKGWQIQCRLDDVLGPTSQLGTGAF